MRIGSATAGCLEQGFTYLGLLLFIAISGIGLAGVGQLWKTEAQRDREKELLFVGEQYAKAIASYYESSPGGAKSYPAKLQDLLLDDRFPVVKRHLRKLYRDPMTGTDEWGTIRQQGRIVGVYSQSATPPIKRYGFSGDWQGFDAAERYSDWKFTLATVQPAADQGSGSGNTATPTEASNPATRDTGGAPSAQAGGGASVTDPSTAPSQADNKPSSSENKRSAGYAECQAQWAAGNAQCRASCGGGAACGACFGQSFAQYRACLRGG